MLNGENSIIKRAKTAKEETEKANTREQEILKDLESMINGENVSSEGYDYENSVNKPELKQGMIPVKYDESKNVWVIADKTNKNKDWYDYDNKKWANIVTVKESGTQGLTGTKTRSEYLSSEVGTQINMEDITTFFVWIPRYAYSIVDGYKVSNTETPAETNNKANKKIDVTFLIGNTNRDIKNNTYETNYDETKLNPGDKTPKIVHPGFRIGNKELTGFWMAKFEASGINNAGNYVGNGTSSSNSQGTESERAPNSDTYVRSLPNAISWRYITIGESEYRCINMSGNSLAYGWGAVNTHLVKNSEWGAVSYLCYSKFGNVPMLNGCGNNVPNSHNYDMYTGMGPASNSSEVRYDATAKSGHEYNTSNGMLASTTGNVYGVYDMSGGVWERVATYLDNGNGNLNTNGKSSSNSSVKYFEGGVLNSSYSSLWDKYEVSSEEKSNSIQVDGESNLTQAELYSKNGTSFTNTATNVKYNTARKRLTDATYNNLEKIKGIGVNEVASSHSYYGVNSSGSYSYMINETDTGTNYGRAWNEDLVLIGYAFYSFVVRGGSIANGIGAGVLISDITNGSAHNFSGFRAVLTP